MGTPTGRGFDSHFGYYQGQETYYSHHFWYDQAQVKGFDFWMNDNVHYDAIGNYSTSLYLQHFQSLLSQQTTETKPFFIYLAFQTIHVPVLDFDGQPENPPIIYSECSNIPLLGRQTYCNKVKYLDEQIGSMIELLQG